ncbi:MAG: FapA family protein [Spirochaetales bacterium]
MVTLEKLRADMETQFENDRNIKYVDVRADTPEEALADAAVQLDTRLSALEYEVLEQGFKGFMTLMKKPWLLRVYENEAFAKKSKNKGDHGDVSSDAGLDEEMSKDVDGMFYLHRAGGAILLKVVAPVGEGIPVDFKMIAEQLKRSDTISFDDNAVRQFVKNSTDNAYEAIGSYVHNQAGDATFHIDVSSDEMEASIIATAPAIGGADITADRIKKMLISQNISVGISDEKIDAFIDNPVYGMPYVVAQAPHPIDGRDAYMVYNFETDKSKLHIKESESGQVDFKELNLIQNVVEGQALAQKILAERGQSGKTLYGRYLEAKNGKDMNIPLGKNVTLDSDERTILAAVNGQALLVSDKVNVEPIMELPAVDIKSGNISFLGTLIVKGNVEDGFNVKVSGNIEVHGTVGNSVLEADGDIVVSLGIMGKDEGHVRAGKSLWAKFIQNCTVESEEFIIVRDGIINSNVTANKKILVQGKRASIIGGNLFATEEIRAKTIGSNAGSNETILSVGYDPKAKRRLDELFERQSALVKELNEVELNLQTLAQQKKIRKTLPPEKEESLARFVDRKLEIQTEVNDISEEIQKLQEHLRELKVIGTVSASGVVHSGVKINIRDIREEIRNETKAVTFFYEDGFVRYGKYEQESKDDDVRDPDGYSTY